MAEKFFITRRGLNTISHRALNGYEKRAPDFYMVSRTAHATWEEAHARILADRLEDVQKARRQLKNAEAAQQRALAMKPKAIPS